MAIMIRDAETKDISSVLEIVNYEILNSTVLYDYKERTYDYQLNWFKQKKADNMPVLVAVDDNRVVGFGTYGIFRPWPAYQFSVEHSIYVDKNSRSNGIGRTLMTTLINLAKASGYHTMIAGIDGSNERSCEFHKQFGFTEVGTIKEVGYKFDRWLDLRFLQLIL